MGYLKHHLCSLELGVQVIDGLVRLSDLCPINLSRIGGVGTVIIEGLTRIEVEDEDSILLQVVPHTS